MITGRMVVLETPFYVVEVDGSGLIVRARRKDVDYPDVAAMESDLHAVCTVLDQVGRDRKKLLIDLRDGPRRNDPAFEEAMSRARPRLFRGFRGAAVLVKTAVGALQVKRHLREDGVGAEVFYEEQEALEYLRGQSVRGEAPPSVIASRRPPPIAERGEEERTSSLPPVPVERRSRQVIREQVPPSAGAPDTLPSRETEDDRASSLPPPPRPARS
jgi:hypothetical protein